MKSTSMTFVCLISTFLCLPSSAQTNIDQAAALAGGVSSCDTPGFPVTICDPGSYRLTSDLDVNSGIGISIQSPDISIDLNGFTVRATSSAATYGITINGGQDNTTITNGSVTNFSNTAVSLYNDARLEDLNIIGNGLGIAIFSGMIRDCRIIGNEGDGIYLAYGNNYHIQGNTISLNDGRGIRQNNTFGGLILDNHISLNTNLGLDLDTVTTYGNNNLQSNNGGGAQASGGNQMGINLCNGTACP